jgi:conjugal transfer ATP-binding protein TraC
VDRGSAPPFFKELAQRRIDHLRRATGQPLWPDSPFRVQRVRLLFSVTREGSPRDHKLVEEMAELRETLRASLRTANLPAFALDAEGLIRFLWPILNPECAVSRSALCPRQIDQGTSHRLRSARARKAERTPLGHTARKNRR